MSKNKCKRSKIEKYNNGKDKSKMDIENSISLDKLQSLKEYMSGLKAVD